METSLELIIRLLKGKFDVGQELSADTELEEIDIDSLDWINFLFSLDEETGVEISDQFIASEEVATLNDIAVYIDKNK